MAALAGFNGLRETLDNEINALAHRLGRNMLVLPAGKDPADFYSLRYGEQTLPDDYPERIRSSSLASQLSAVQARLYGNAQMRGVSVVVIGEATARGGTAAVPDGHAVLGTEAARRRGLRPGDPFPMGGKSLTVAAVTGSPPEGLDNGVFTSLATAQGVLGRPGAINVLRMGGCWCRTYVPALGTKAIVVRRSKEEIACAEALGDRNGKGTFLPACLW